MTLDHDVHTLPFSFNCLGGPACMTTTHENFPFSVLFPFFVLFCMISEFGLAGAWAMVWKGRATHIHTLWFSLSVLAIFTIGRGTLGTQNKVFVKIYCCLGVSIMQVK